MKSEKNRGIDKFILSTKGSYLKEPNRHSEAEKYNEYRNSLDRWTANLIRQKTETVNLKTGLLKSSSEVREK